MSGDLLSGVWRQQELPDFTARQWEALLGQARRGRLLARLGRHFSEQGLLDAVPAAPQAHLRAAARVLGRQQHELRAELLYMRRALQEVNTPVVLLKGAAYALAGLPPAPGRLFSDIDILVDRSHLHAVEGALFAAGWMSQERDAYNQHYYRQWMHEIPPLEHVRRGSVVDLHHTIAPPTSRFRIDAARLFERIRPVGASGFFVLGPEDMVLHSAVHLYQEGEFHHGLRDLLDLHDLIRHFEREPGFWPALLARAREFGLGEPLYQLLRQARRRLGLQIPAAQQAALEGLQPGGLRRRCIAALLDLGLRPAHPSCDSRLAAGARSLLYLRSHFIRMPAYLLLPHLLRKAYMRRFPATARAAGPTPHPGAAPP